MATLDHELDRTVHIRAQRATVFGFFTDSERFARWWGAGSTVDPRPGGEVRIVYPNGIVASGHVVEIVEGERFVFTFGYESGTPIAPGASQVSIALHDAADGTRLELRHAFDDAAVRDQHDPGWRYQLAVFANVACAVQHAGLEAVVDGWAAAWSETDAGPRADVLARCTSDDVAFHDAHGCVRGRDELNGHIGAVQMHMPGAALKRVGVPRQCQGYALSDWEIVDPQGQRLAHGTHALVLAPDGRIAQAVGFPAAP